jgi:hypothetical protein
MIPVPENEAEARFTNLAPGATVTVSSGTGPAYPYYLIDRKVKLAFAKEQYWHTYAGVNQNQWVRLNFPVPIKISTVRLYNIPPGGKENSSIQVHEVQGRSLCRYNCNAACSQQNSLARSGGHRNGYSV